MPAPKWEETQDIIPTWEDTHPIDDISKLGSAYKGAIAGGSFNFQDELAGAVEAAGGLFGVSGAGTEPIGSWKEQTPEEKTRSLLETYKSARDKVRKEHELYRSANPKSYFAGSIAGGAAVPFGAATKAKSLGEAVKYGAQAGIPLGMISGYGSNVDSNDLGLDVLTGGITGGIGGSIGGTLGYGASKLFSPKSAITPNMSIETKPSVLKEDFMRGSKLAEENAWPFLKAPQKILGGIKEIIASSKASDSFKKMIEDSKDKFVSQMVESGSGKETPMNARSFLSKMGDDEYILWAINNGDEDIIKWIAQNAANEGANFSPEQLTELLKIPPSERASLRNYDISAKARELEPITKEASQAVESSYKNRFSDLSKEAQQKFGTEVKDKGLIYDVFFGQKDAMARANSLNTAKAAKPILEDTANILYGNTDHYGFTKGKGFNEIDPAEQFMRLQKSRELIDDGIDYAALKIRKPTEAERILLEQKGRINNVLKSLDTKAEADKVYAIGKKIDEMVFGKTEFKGGVDPYKIKRLLGNSDDANRFRDGLSYLKDWAENSTDPLAKETAQKFLDNFNKVFSEYTKSQKITAANFRGGPTSQAVERGLSRLKKDNIVTEAIQSPVTFMKRQENLLKNFSEVLNLPAWKDMSYEDQMGLVRLMTWAKNQESGITPEAIKKNFELFKRMK